MGAAITSAKLDLQRFCATESDPREYLRAPWRVGQWVYCTNGHLALRMPAEAYPDVLTTTAKVPDVGALFKRTMEDRACEFLLMPPLPVLMDCDACDGNGRICCVKCPDCEGGEFTHGNYTYECKNCEGWPAGGGWEFRGMGAKAQEGEVVRACESCNGTGYPFRANGSTQLGNAHYANVYLAMFAVLPQVRVCPGDPARANYDDPRELPAAFIFDGGHGLLMPMRKD